jgi:hypothetical protein
MDRLKKSRAAWKKFKELSPAFIVLPLVIVFHFFWGPHPSVDIWRIISWVLPRFFGYTLFLCLPLYLVKPIYSSILEGRQGFILVDSPRPFEIRWLKHWLFRPFQGIGISFLFATRLLSVIHTISGPALDSSIPFTPGELNVQRFVVAMTITVLISLGLSVLWTFDDLGIRYHNRKDHELKMIGKYVGTIVPLTFGLYGIFNLHIQHAHQLGESPFLHVFRIVINLYPPLVVFAVVHNYFIKKRAKHFSDWVSLTKGGIWQETKKGKQGAEGIDGKEVP